MGDAISVKVDTKAVVETFDVLDKRVKSKTPLFQIGVEMVKSTVKHFENESGPDGSGWMPSWRVRMGGGQTLSDKGTLKASLDNDVRGNSVIVGTNLKKARTLQYGAARGKYGRTKYGVPVPWGNIPARPFLGISNDDRKLIMRILTNFVTEGK